MTVRNEAIWVNRKFQFDLPVEMFPMVVERLRGAPVRLEEKLRGVPSDVLKRRVGDAWSIQEQVGHLMDVEMLWLGRLDDFAAGLARLRPADITNTVTSQADHNAASLSDLLAEFRKRRSELVRRLDEIGVAGAGRTAHHPRLDQPMRVIDSALFAAEHDDHHLAKMTGMLVPRS
jgi:uncharacterized damage-inducible protein DinB